VRHSLRKKAIACAFAVPLFIHACPAFALGLLEAYEAALENDPVYQSAVHENEAGQQYRVLGRSNLLPSLSAQYTKSKNRADIVSPNFLGQLQERQRKYKSNAGAVSLRQPLFNLEAVARYKQGVAHANYSDAQFAGRTRDLMVRVVSAYADAQYAEDQLALVTAQRDAYAEQKQVNQRMFEKGEGTKTDVLETQAKFDLAEAQVIEAQDSLTVARNTLAAIVGDDVDRLDPMSDDFKVKPMQPVTFDEWKAIALERNAEIATLQFGVEAARQEVAKARSGHLPRVDLVASYGKNDSETINTLDQESKVRSVGVQLSMPIYSGGSTSALSRQARANHARAQSDLDAKTKQVLVELRKQYSLVLSSAARINALVKSVDSAKTLVEATRQSIKGGVRINLDLLNAEQQLFAAKRDLARARYDYLLGYLKLRSAAGTLAQEDLHNVAGYFIASR
jgi:protease secretion system outer membrane protein